MLASYIKNRKKTFKTKNLYKECSVIKKILYTITFFHRISNMLSIVNSIYNIVLLFFLKIFMTFNLVYFMYFV